MKAKPKRASRNGQSPRPLTNGLALNEPGWRVLFAVRDYSSRRAISHPMPLHEAVAVIKMFECERGIDASLLPPEAEGDAES